MHLCYSVDASETNLVIKQKSGGETILELSSNPVITFENDIMLVNNDFTSIYIPLDDIDGYTVTEETTGINAVENTPKYEDGHIIFDRIKNGQTVFVYTIDGKIVSRYKGDNNGRVDIDMNTLPKDIYIISTPGSKIKTTNK